MNSVKVYSLESCSYCVRAKALLRSRGIEYEEIKIDPNNASEIDELVRRSGQRTFPQIFIGNELIGGFSDLEDLDKKGKLMSLVAGEKKPTVKGGCCHGH